MMGTKIWFVATTFLFILASFMLSNSLYWLITSHNGEYTQQINLGSLAFPIILYGLTYWTWKKARTHQEGNNV